MEGKRVRVANRFLLGKKLGNGSFGVVYQAYDSTTSKQVAVKLESVRVKVPQLANEASTIRALTGSKGFPELLWNGTEGAYNILVTDLLGDSLETNAFSLTTVVACALQTLERLQTLQEKNFVHRDLKPDNILIGTDDPDTTYLIDFGLARKYRDPKTKQHIPYKENKSLTGTARYASVNSHLGIEQSRRDDLESLVYILVYFFKGILPWQGIKEKNKRVRYIMIGEAKRQASPKVICQGMPEEFGDILEYARAMRFEEPPNYTMLMSKLSNLAKKFRFNLTQLDWTYKQPPRVNARAETRKESKVQTKPIRRSRSNKITSPGKKRRSSTMSPMKPKRSESVETVKLVVKPFFRDKQVLQRLRGADPSSCLLF
mmetsp:Transcript_16484/g.29730  ORF Transcript_16484/g.29730 Transcript_16484/m.29730 type:complete len:373 (+) Transcript_16484:270-1388(+)